MLTRNSAPLEDCPAIIDALGLLPRLDPDHAGIRNTVGFSAADSTRGRLLASLVHPNGDGATKGLDLVLRHGIGPRTYGGPSPRSSTTVLDDVSRLHVRHRRPSLVIRVH